MIFAVHELLMCLLIDAAVTLTAMVNMSSVCANTILLFPCCVNNSAPHDGSNLLLNHTTMAAGFFTSRAFLLDFHFPLLSGGLAVDPL